MAGSKLPTRQEGEVLAPIAVSVSCAALCLGAISTGRTMIRGVVEAEDVHALAAVLRAMGAQIAPRDGGWGIVGCGVGGLTQPKDPLELDIACAGTPMLLGVVAGHDMTAHILGAPALATMNVLTPLGRMGVEVTGGPASTSPVVVRGTCDLMPVDHTDSTLGADAASAALFAGLHTPGRTTVLESASTPGFLAHLIKAFGGVIGTSLAGGVRRSAVTGPGELTGKVLDLAGIASD